MDTRSRPESRDVVPIRITRSARIRVLTAMRAILSCSGGGHLTQLFALAPRIGIAPDDQTWVTFDNDLSRSLLADRRVVHVPFAAPRDVLAAGRIALIVRRLLESEHFDLAVSTGAIPGVSLLPQTSRRGIPSHYIESAARADGPSLSGRIVARTPRVHMYTQYPGWANERWKYRGSIFDGFEPGPPREAPPGIRRAVVTVGTQEDYGFDRLFAAIEPLLAGAEVLWQTGPRDVSRYGIRGRKSVPHAELSRAMAEADVVIAHAGTGSAITALEVGRCPVLVPRLARHREHVDDHQLQIAAELERRRLALRAHPEQLTLDLLLDAATRTAVPVVDAPPFPLD
jgi:UDP-N-acetylglucosamine transferase subunit ALG13